MNIAKKEENNRMGKTRDLFKKLDLIEYLKNYGRTFMTLYKRQ